MSTVTRVKMSGFLFLLLAMLASRPAFGNENPRSITPLTTLNIVATLAIPSASTITARAQKDFSLTSRRRPILISRIPP